jgi:hypothetical protein
MTYNPPITTPQSNDAVIINDHDHTLTWCELRTGARGVHIGQGQNRLFLSPTEIVRLIDAITEFGGQPNRTVYTTSTPAKARLMRYPITKPNEAKNLSG